MQFGEGDESPQPFLSVRIAAIAINITYSRIVDWQVDVLTFRRWEDAMVILIFPSVEFYGIL